MANNLANRHSDNLKLMSKFTQSYYNYVNFKPHKLKYSEQILSVPLLKPHKNENPKLFIDVK